MNERIRQLAEQAGFVLIRDEYLFTEMMGKFAELIVGECIAQCNDGDSQYFIAKHFGVEEK